MELKQLYEAGVLTKEELASEKAKLMSPTSAKVSAPQKSTESQSIVATSQPETVVSEPKQVDMPTPAKITNDSERKDAPEKSENNILRRIVIVFIIIAIGLGIFAYYKKGSDENRTDNRTQVNTANTTLSQHHRTFATLLDQGYVYLQGHISEVPVSMYLKFYQNEEGYESMRDDIVLGILHYDNQPANTILMVKGNFTQDGSITLGEFDGNRHSGDIHGTLDGYSFDGEYVTSNLAFVASVQDNPKIPAIYEKLTDFLFSEEYSDDVGNNTIIAFTDKNVYYIEGSYIDGVSIFDHDCGMGHIYNLTIEDLSKETENKIPIQNTSECWYEIKGVMCTNHRITFILEDRGRNSIGSSNYSTQVTQYNIDTGKWKTIAKDMASAEFINDGKKLRVLNAYIINEDEVYSAYDYIWAYEEEIINL